MLTTGFANLLAQLIGSGFTVSLITDGVQIVNQKVVNVTNDVVYTVNNAGLIRATAISSITSVDY